MADIRIFVHNQLPDGVTLKAIKKGAAATKLDPSPSLPGYEIVSGYNALADLSAKIRAVVARRPNDALSEIDFNAHGTPVVHNSIQIGDVQAWGRFLMTFPWADQADLYLAGCNTGISLDRKLNDPDHGPIAERLAQAMPFNAQSFAHRITVHGTVGFCYGSHARGIKTERQVVEASYGTRAVRVGRHTVPFPVRKVRIVHAAYPDGKDASGDQCFRGFKNW